VNAQDQYRDTEIYGQCHSPKYRRCSLVLHSVIDLQWKLTTEWQQCQDDDNVIMEPNTGRSSGERMGTPLYDVIQVGYGPVSQTLALMLGRQGRSVAVVERWKTRYPLPRAVCVDHELYRVLSANGMRESLPAVTHGGSLYQWFNAEWKELLVIDWSRESISGGPGVHFVHQPTLEEALDRAVAAQPTVDTHLGWEAVAVEQDEALCRVTLRNVDTQALRQLSARFVVGCDGANSMVRSAIGGELEDRGFEADWLVIDVRLKDGVTIEKLGIPAAGQYCNPVRPTTIVPAGIRDGRLFRRWEFMRLPGESNEELERESRVWQLLKPWAGPDEIELVRHKVYNFRSLMAERWRRGRFLIAGDAAHVMPPFMGQGMCSGMRDAWNLAWKLSLVLDGKARIELLDTYQQERMPHVSQLIDMSIYLGKIICIPDPEAAAERDLAFLGGTAPLPPPFPQLTTGLLLRNADGSLSAGAGLLSPHGTAIRTGVTGRFDDVVGLGFILVSRHEHRAEQLSNAILDELPMRYVMLNGVQGTDVVTDVDGRLSQFMEGQEWDVMLVRPDFYVYGGATGPDSTASLIRQFIVDIEQVGLCRSA
jgi:2-polyprenyl-6-methoxyphenol hydroxylase-like FAD-dependent oxidoreductase